MNPATLTRTRCASSRRGWRTLALALFATGCATSGRDAPVVVASKSFTESVILGEIATMTIGARGIVARHRRQLGGTRIVFNALVRGDIDAYPEYTGTLLAEIFSDRTIDGPDELKAILADQGILMSRPLGFDNSYGIGTRRELAERLHLRTVSDLRGHPRLVFGFSNEFMDRADGWPGLRGRYGLTQEARGLDHDLAYRGLASGSVDLMDVYLTDAEIDYYDLAILEDDRDFFSDYQAVWLYRKDLADRAPRAEAALLSLQGTINAETMRGLNRKVKLDGVPSSRAVASFLLDHLGIEGEFASESAAQRIGRHTLDHLKLVAVSLFAGILLALPLGILAARLPRLGHAILGLVGILQTIPSLALLVFMIPLLGIGATPAIAALFVYSLLPIVRNTHAGLTGISPELSESAHALGLPSSAILMRVELPLATPSILAGIKTAAVINIGTATLGALIGAGGLGQPILTGIRLDDTSLILQGAIPAAALAIAAQMLFDLAERLVVPKGLRRK